MWYVSLHLSFRDIHMHMCVYFIWGNPVRWTGVFRIVARKISHSLFSSYLINNSLRINRFFPGCRKMPKICTWKRHFALFAAPEYIYIYIVRVTREKMPSFLLHKCRTETSHTWPGALLRGTPARKSFLSFASNNSLVVDYNNNNLRPIVRSGETLVPYKVLSFPRRCSLSLSLSHTRTRTHTPK